MKLNTTSALTRLKRRGFTLVELLVVIAIIAALAGLSYGPIMRQIRAADRTEAISNGRSITAALIGFYANNDRQFPNGSTNADGSGTDPATGEDALQQLFDAGMIEDKQFFWNRSNAGVSCGPNEPASDNILVAADNAWSYVMNLDASDGLIPIIFDSSNDGGATFNNAVWDGKAIVGRVDGSINAEQLTYIGPIVDGNGNGTPGVLNIQGRGGSQQTVVAACTAQSVGGTILPTAP